MHWTDASRLVVIAAGVFDVSLTRRHPLLYLNGLHSGCAVLTDIHGFYVVHISSGLSRLLSAGLVSLLMLNVYLAMHALGEYR